MKKLAMMAPWLFCSLTATAFSETLSFYEATVDENMQVKLKTTGSDCEKSQYTTYKDAVAAQEKRVLAQPPVNGVTCTGRLEGASLKSKSFEKTEQVPVVIDCGTGSVETITFVKDSRKCRVMLEAFRKVEAARSKK